MSNLNVFKITVSGKHKSKFSDVYFGVAPDIESAMSFAEDVAVNDGWEEFNFDSIVNLGDMLFFVVPPDDDSFLKELKKTDERAIKSIKGVITEITDIF